MSSARIDGLNVENARALAVRLRERADGLPQDAEDHEGIMESCLSDHNCGTVGCIWGEFDIWQLRPPGSDDGVAFNRFMGLSPRTEGRVIFLHHWLSDAHQENFSDEQTIAERLRVMASYLDWLAGAEA